MTDSEYEHETWQITFRSIAVSLFVASILLTISLYLPESVSLRRKFISDIEQQVKTIIFPFHVEQCFFIFNGLLILSSCIFLQMSKTNNDIIMDIFMWISGVFGILFMFCVGFIKITTDFTRKSLLFITLLTYIIFCICILIILARKQ